jgi:hypothetical protein
MAARTLLRTCFATAAAAFLASCAEYPTAVAPAPTPPPVGYWNGDGVPGSPKIVVSISEQHAYFFKGKNLVGESTVSTGKPGFGTPPGQYTVLSKDAAHVSTVFGDYVDDFGNVVKSNIDSRKDSKPPGSHYDGARMPFAMFFRGGYAMHQGYVPPYAASHGCIRLPRGMAEIFFNASPPGTPVIVKQEPVMPDFTIPADAAAVTPPAPNVVRSSGPPPAVRPAVVRSTIPAPTPVPLRSPAPVVSRAPGTFPFRSPSPTPTLVRSTVPAPVRPNVVRTTVATPTPAPVRSPAPVITRAPATVPVRTPTPAPLRSPAPNVVRSSTVPNLTPVPVRSPSPAPLRSPAPASVKPTPTPAASKTKKHVRKRTHHRSQTPSPTPAPAQ